MDTVTGFMVTVVCFAAVLIIWRLLPKKNRKETLKDVRNHE